jgi:lysyl-tRNA synthetase class 2
MATNEHQQRTEKIDRLRANGVDPFPSQAHRTVLVAMFLEQFEDCRTRQTVHTLAGRIRLKREHGKLTFMQLEDATGIIQVVFSEPEIGSEQYAFVTQYVDVGDIVEVSGTAFVTKKGEQSVLVQTASLLTKSVFGLPDKWHGIQDEEMRYRRRYVDMIMRPEIREMLIRKSRFWNAMREFLTDEGFIEVETPVLESTPGGADAQPFVTHHNALGIDLFLRISMGELWQKRLMVAGFDKTFEIGRQFRNEGISPEHLQDYTQMEFYWGYANYRDSMRLVERMYKHCIMKAFGTLQFTIRGFAVDFDQPWAEVDYVAAITEKLGVDVLVATDAELKTRCTELGIKNDADTRARMIDSLWKHCRKSIGGPVFLVNHPVEVSPLAKRKPEDPRRVERFQVLIAGSEQGNGYSELNDPFDQEARFQEQARMREAGDSEAQMHDQDFVDALKVGMPPTSGFGVSERLFSFLMDKPIRECVAFPLLRPKDSSLDEAAGGTGKGPSGEATASRRRAGAWSVAEDGFPVTGPASSDEDPSLKPFDAGITRDAAHKLMLEHVKDENLRRHNVAAGIIMEALAKHFGAANPESWEISGVLHDVDYEEVPMEQHSLAGAAMLASMGIHPMIVEAVREHNYMHKLEPKTIMSKSLMCLEQLTGLITAAAYVQPDKKVASVKLSSLKKKIKDKAFARGVDRTMLSQCESLLGMQPDDAYALCLTAMQARADELGL